MAAGIWLSSLRASRRTRFFLTTFTAAFVVAYAILAFSSVQFSTVTKKSDCVCEGHVLRNVENNLRNVAEAPPDTQSKSNSDAINGVPVMQHLLNNQNEITNATVNVTTPPKRIGEFVQFLQVKGLVVVEDDYNKPNETVGHQVSSQIRKKVQKKKSKFYHVFKPRIGQKSASEKQQQGDGVFTRFGFIGVSDLHDHAFLSKDEVKKLSQFFIYDYFSKSNSTSSETILTFENRNQRYPSWKNGEEQQIVRRPLCPMRPPKLKGKVSLAFDDLTPPSLLDIQYDNPKVTLGGKFTPDCHPRSKIAIIVPYRGREFQLLVLLAHMHPIWQRQQIDYTVYIVSQLDDGTIFNKAKVMNIGFLEASKYDTYDCYVFHDVDMTLEDDRCLYRCLDSDDARELAVHLDKFDYQELKYHLRCKPDSYPEQLYAKYFGGVAMMTEKQMLDVNGYSNLFWGWGSEDIDMYLRLWKRGYKILQPYGRSCSYHMIKHQTEASNRRNNGRFALLANSIDRMRYEGLTSTRYKVLDVEQLPLYTNITVEVGRPKSSLAEFMDLAFSTFQEQCEAMLPWQ